MPALLAAEDIRHLPRLLQLIYGRVMSYKVPRSKWNLTLGRFVVSKHVPLDGNRRVLTKWFSVKTYEPAHIIWLLVSPAIVTVDDSYSDQHMLRSIPADNHCDIASFELVKCLFLSDSSGGDTNNITNSEHNSLIALCLCTDSELASKAKRGSDAGVQMTRGIEILRDVAKGDVE